MTVANHFQLQWIREVLADGTVTGNQVTFQYDSTTGRLGSVSSHDGRSVSYTHTVVQSQGIDLTDGNLIRVDGLEDVVSNYRYEDSNFLHALTYMQKGIGTTPYINEYDPKLKKLLNKPLAIRFSILFIKVIPLPLKKPLLMQRD